MFGVNDMEWKEQIIEEFKKEFVNDHNDEERFLRGLFIEDFYKFLENSLDSAYQQGRRVNCWKCKLWHDHNHGDSSHSQVKKG